MIVSRGINRSTWNAAYKAFRLRNSFSVPDPILLHSVDSDLFHACSDLLIKDDELAFRCRIVRAVSSIKSYIKISRGLYESQSN